MIFEASRSELPTTRRAHTVVIGSGAGGAVVAHTLAAAGVETVVLEDGGLFRAADMSQREDRMLPALYRERGQQMTSDGLVNVLQGSCYGGSTVVNAADCEPTPPEVYAHWRLHHAIEGIDEYTLADSQRRVEERLGVGPIAPEQVNRNNSLLLAGAAALGWRAGRFRHNRTGCIGSGTCMIGCAYDAKRGAHLNYLPAAALAGADVYTDVRALRLERAGAGRWRVLATTLERGSRRALKPFTLEAERVVLAAGAVHSPALLAASGFAAGLPQLGCNLTLQPQTAVTALFEREGDLVPWRGIPQSAFCSEHDEHTAEHGLGGFRVESISSGLGQMASLLPGFGHAHKQRMLRARQTAAALLLVPDRPSGRLRFDPDGPRGGAPRIEYRMQAEWLARLRRGLHAAAELYFAAGASEVGFASDVFTPLRSPDELGRVFDFPVRSGVTRFISAHVQGTCRMAPDARRGVVDLDHRVHGLPGLYVVDASVMPSSASTHTMIPIMTLADRAARLMLET